MTSSKDEYTVTTTQLSLTILDIVAELNGARMSDIVDELDIAKSTAHKHLSTLVQNGYLTKSGEIYQIGLKYLYFGELARAQWQGFSEIKETVEDLTKRTDEECDFVAPDRGKVITIVESYHKWAKHGNGSRVDTSGEYCARTGLSYYMHATASGLAILATYPRERVEEIIERWGLPKRTEQTITTRTRLYDELDQIRERGYAIDDEGYTEGMCSIGKAVHNPDGQVVGALSVSGPTYRIDGVVLKEEIPNTLSDVVNELEENLKKSYCRD